MVSIKRNFVYSSVLTTANYIFPLLTYPYASRVLGVDRIGICNFVDSIINYFILFSVMGIGIIGIREIARSKDNKEDLNKTFSSLFLLNTISTSLVLIVLIGAIFLVPKLQAYKDMMWIGVLKLISNYLLIEWLYKGLEKFKLITYRTIIVRTLYVVSVFLFVREAADYKIYFLLLSLSIALNAIFNCYYAKEFVQLTFRKVLVGKYCKSSLILGSYTLLTSMYTSFNVAYLGFVSNDTEVGYYTTATKLYSIFLSLFTAFTGVLLPRMSALIAENNFYDFKILLRKSIKILSCFSIPVIIFCEIFAEEIIHFISGNGYSGAIIPMRIVMPLLLIIGCEQILVIQTLMPLKMDKAILINSIVGAFIGIILNVLLVANLQSIGTAIVWVSSEFFVLCCAQFFVWKKLSLLIPIKMLFKQIMLNMPLVLLFFVILSFDLSGIYTLLIAGFCLLLYSLLIQIFVNKIIPFSLILKIVPWISK